MNKKEFHSRLKEFRLGGVVALGKGRRWVIPRTHNFVGGEVLILPTYTHHGTRVAWVTFKGPHFRIRKLRRSIDSEPSKKSRQVRPMSPNQLFELLGKLARGEINE